MRERVAGSGIKEMARGQIEKDMEVMLSGLDMSCGF